jgi:hypothetical protein
VPNQVQQVDTKLDRAAGAGRRELDEAVVVTGYAVDVGNGDDHRLKLHIEILNALSLTPFVLIADSCLVRMEASQASLPADFLAGRANGVIPACSSAVYGAP